MSASEDIDTTDDAGSREVFKWLEVNLREGRYDVIDEGLNSTVVLMMPEKMLAILSLTRFERGKFKNREGFLLRCETELVRRLGFERAQALLAGRR